MLRDVPHVKAFLALGFCGMVFAVAIGTWVYPSFRARCGEARTEATRSVWGEMYGISDAAAPAVVRASGDLTDEMRRSVGESDPGALPARSLNRSTTPVAAASADAPPPPVPATP